MYTADLKFWFKFVHLHKGLDTDLPESASMKMHYGITLLQKAFKIPIFVNDCQSKLAAGSKRCLKL